MQKIIVSITLLTLGTAACAGAQATPSVGDIQTAIAQTEAARPAATSTATQPIPPSPSPTLAPSHTPTPVEPLEALVNVVAINLRGGPGTMFEIRGSYDQGATVQAFSRVAEGDWVQVETEDGESGWMLAELLTFQADHLTLPITFFPQALVLRGVVQDSEGEPVSGINVAVIFRSESAELRADVFSGEDGQWVVYLPEDLLGTLDVQIVGISCDSRIMDLNCALARFFEAVGRVFVNIPAAEPVQFLYQIATATLQGLVRNTQGNPIAGITVVAERDDGAETYGTTDSNGVFQLPAGEGTWEVYAVRFEPRRESQRVSITLLPNVTPTSIILTAP